MRPRLAHLVKKPFKYTDSHSTDIRKTIAKARKAPPLVPPQPKEPQQ